MSTQGAMGAVGEDREDPSPSLSLLQRLKRLREWQERQRQELLQIQTHAHTPTGSYLPSLKEESSISFESTFTEDSTPTPAVVVPQKVEDCDTPVGLPGVGPPSHVIPVTSNLQVNSTSIEGFTPPTLPTAVPQGFQAPAGISGVGLTSLVVPVASDLPVKSSLSHPKEVNPRLQEEDARKKLLIHDNLDTEKLDTESGWERESGTSEGHVSPLTSGSSPMFADASHSQGDPEECDQGAEGKMRENEGEYDSCHTTDTQAEAPYSPSPSPHEYPSEDMDESMEDLLSEEIRMPYRSEKYKSSAANKQASRLPEVSQKAKNLVPSRSFFSALTQMSEDDPEGMEEMPRPKCRFLKKGEGTARFRMRPMRLRRARTEAEKECGWQGSKDSHQTPSLTPPPSRSQLRLPLQSLQVQGTPSAVGGQRSSLVHCLQGTERGNAVPTLALTQQPTHPARPPAPSQQPFHPARPPAPSQSSIYPARPPAPTQQPTQPTFHPSICPTTQNPARPPASTVHPAPTTTHPSNHPTTHNPTRPPPHLFLDLEKQQRKEEVELSAFEKLEELAEDSSFSSNSSTVWGLLRQGQHSVSSTPLRTPPPLALQETPVVGSLSTKPRNLGQSHFTGDLGGGTLPPASAPQHQQTGAPLDVKKILTQLKAIVRLEGHSISDITESDIQSFLDECSSNISHQPSDAPHPTSTPLSPQPALPPQTRPHHVRFANEGVQVLEYQLSDTEGEETLTDATSLDSDMITTSDLEALSQFNIREVMADTEGQQSESCRKTDNADTSGEATLTGQESPQELQPVVLHFSPPPPRPPQSASNYIWSIFGKERDAKKLPAPNQAFKKTIKETSHQPPPKPQQAERRDAPRVPQASPRVDASQEELEVHKTLLLAKVAELEKETKLFKKENAKLLKLQQEVKEEKQKLEEEKWKLHEEVATERKRFHEYVDRERNALWNQRQQMVQRPPPPVTQPQEHLSEVIRLREQVREMREEAQRKESLNQFTVKKLNDRIKYLEKENKKLQDRNNSLQTLEKENQDLRLKVDRGKAGGRMRPSTQPTRPSQVKAARGRPKVGTRPTTVDGVTKTLDRLTKPQPVIIREGQTKVTMTNKQDQVNNNLRAGHTEVDEAVLVRQESNTDTHSPHISTEQDTPVAEEASHTISADGVKHIKGQTPWRTPGCGEEAGLEHTERVREDGVQEVIYANGNRKEIHPSGDVTVSFYNGDRKEVKADRTVYVYGSDHTSHTTYSDGREELIFPNGQREMRHPDGSSEISFPDGSRKSVMSDSTEICTTKDGSVVRSNPDGSKVFEFPSGQREVHRGGEKRREYPNGTVKIVHPDGRMETRYNSGRIRIRDREGNVILDTHISLSPPPSLHPSLPS